MVHCLNNNVLKPQARPPILTNLHWLPISLNKLRYFNAKQKILIPVTGKITLLPYILKSHFEFPLNILKNSL